MTLTPLGQERLNDELTKLITKYGMNDVIGGLARYSNDHEKFALFRKLNRIYEWLIR